MAYELSDDEWVRLESLLPKDEMGRPCLDLRRTLNGIKRVMWQKVSFNGNGAHNVGLICGAYHYSYALTPADAILEADFWTQLKNRLTVEFMQFFHGSTN